MLLRFLAVFLLATSGFLPAFAQTNSFSNSIGMWMKEIPAGTFVMGSEAGDLDEGPAHTVRISNSFYMSIAEVTNAQYEAFDPGHREVRGKLGFSKEDHEAVVFVSWHDAVAFTEWLSEKEGKPYRLPTEAEWEYAARANSRGAYAMGDTLPEDYLKNPRQSWYPDKDRPHPGDVVPLRVAMTSPNVWGLYDIHGNVEEWVLDWYGPYSADGQVDPVGYADGDFKVTRGGSHSTEPYYLRSANRAGTLPEDAHWLIGFRVVMGEMPATEPLPVPAPTAAFQRNVRQDTPPEALEVIDPETPFFASPRPYILQHPTEKGPFFYHNHQAAITETPNGDLMAIWYTTKEESGRYLAQAASRLRFGESDWEPAGIFWDAPDRNDHGNALWWDGDQTIYHVSGLSAAATWGNLALVVRTSTDNGVSWSKGHIVNPHHGLRNQVIASMIQGQNGELIVAADAVSIGDGGTALHISRDEGQTWEDAGGTIAGIHASVVQLNDGRLLALGRGDTIDGRMPMSISDDMGKTWTYQASPFDPLSSTQRLVLIRLKEGPLFMASFSDGMMMEDAAGQPLYGRGLFGALSFDEGQTWPVQRLVVPDEAAHWETTARSRQVLISPYTAEPRGYMAVTQARNGVIHLISSFHHYAFNMAWLQEAPSAPQRFIPNPSTLAPLEASQVLSNDFTRVHGDDEQVTIDGGHVHIEQGSATRIEWQHADAARWKAHRENDMATIAFQAKVEASARPDRGLDVFLHVGEQGRQNYHLSITPDGVYTYDGFSLDPVKLGMDNAAELHTYRVEIRTDGLMDVFRDGELVGILSPAAIQGEGLRIGMEGAGKAEIAEIAIQTGDH